MNTKRDLEADRKICDAATVGPWIKYKSSGDVEAQVFDATDTFPIVTFGFTNEDADATFITEARTGWPAALDEIARLQSEVQRYRQALESIVMRSRCYVSNTAARELRKLARRALDESETSRDMGEN